MTLFLKPRRNAITVAEALRRGLTSGTVVLGCTVAAPNSQTRDVIEWSEVVTKFLQGLAALTIPFLVFYMKELVVERRAEATTKIDNRQIEALDEGRAASGLLTIIATGKEKDRQAALNLLEQVAPAYAAKVAALVSQSATTQEEKNAAAEVQRSAARRVQRSIFDERLKAARSYRSFGLYGQSADAFLEAWNSVPEAYILNSVVARSDVDRALKEYGEGNFAASSDSFIQAFKKVQQQ